MGEGPESRTSFYKFVWPIAVAETMGYAAFFYTFPSLILEWEAEFGWSRAEVSVAMTMLTLMSAGLAPFVGNIIDRGRGRSLFLVGMAVGAIILGLISQVTALWQFYALYLTLSISFATSLYEPTFAIMTRALPDQSRKAITQITLFAGFASTISFPMTSWLVEQVGWRTALLVWAAVMLFLVTPLSWWGFQHAAWPESGPETGSEPQETHPIAPQSHYLRLPLFWVLALTFSLSTLNHSALLTHLLPIFEEKGVPDESAIFAASLIGPAQVFGRLIIAGLGDRASAVRILYVCYITLAIAAVILFNSGRSSILVILFVVLQGAGNGIISIIRPVATAEMLGRERFGTVSGMISIPVRLASAAAPICAAIIWGWRGYDLVILIGLSALLLGIFGIRQASLLARVTPNPVRHSV